MDVWCEICGAQWDSRDPGVRFVHGDGRWECADEVQCFARRATWRALFLAVDADNRRCALTGQEAI